MSKDTNNIKKEKKSLNKEKLIDENKIISKEEINEDEKNFHVVEHKSVQNKVIDNIKNFISKIIEMQEKIKQDEEEEKRKDEDEKKELEKLEKQDENSKYLLEYYDLPYRYNETIVKILAQTPKRLFVYWDISDKDKQTYLNAFGEKFFQDTYPVLLLHNENKNYTREITINDFANSWYLDISDPRDKYTIQLGRKFKQFVKPHVNQEIIEEENITINNDYLFIAMSNKLEIPNDHILFEEFKPYVKYRNVKTNQEEIKDLTNTIYKNELESLYNELYNEEIDGETFDLRNPSSMGTSSSIAK